MGSRYKLIISGKTLHKEIEIPPDAETIVIATSGECDIRLRRDLFFAPISIKLERYNLLWNITCSDNLYFTVGDVRKLITKQLQHGDELFVKYQESNTDVFNISFLIDFDPKLQ